MEIPRLIKIRDEYTVSYEIVGLKKIKEFFRILLKKMCKSEIQDSVKGYDELIKWHEILIYNLQEEIIDLKKKLELYKIGASELFLNKPNVHG